MCTMTVGTRDPETWPLGPMLRDQRNKLGLSLGQVAKRASLGRATVTYYETGYRADNGAEVNPTPKVLRPLAEALELDVDEVFEVAGITPARQRTDEDVAAEVERRSSLLAEHIAMTGPEFRRALETMVYEHLRALGLLDEAATAEVKSGPAELRTAAPAAGPDEQPLGNNAGDQAQLPL